VLLAFVEADAIEAQVWGTQGLNDCPEADWASVDTLSIAEEFGATVAVANGPRHWVLDQFSGERPPGSPRMFGTLEMQLLATLTLAPGTTSSVPYAERTVLRDSVFEFWAGSEIYELVAPDGSVYVMQSYAQIVDPSLSEGDLSGLGARLTLPADWLYRARTRRPSCRTSCRTPIPGTSSGDKRDGQRGRRHVGRRLRSAGRRPGAASTATRAEA